MRKLRQSFIAIGLALGMVSPVFAETFYNIHYEGSGSAGPGYFFDTTDLNEASGYSEDNNSISSSLCFDMWGGAAGVTVNPNSYALASMSTDGYFTYDDGNPATTGATVVRSISVSQAFTYGTYPYDLSLDDQPPITLTIDDVDSNSGTHVTLTGDGDATSITLQEGHHYHFHLELTTDAYSPGPGPWDVGVMGGWSMQ